MTANSLRSRPLGRKRPKFIAHGKRFSVLVHHDGSVAVVPQLGFHYDPKKDKDPPPSSTNWIAKAQAAMGQVYGNAPDPAYPNAQPEGDCVIASLLRVIGAITGNESGTVALSTTPEALQQYETICGAGDQGCVITQVLDYAKANGVKLSGVVHKIDDYVALDTTNFNLVQVAIEVFGPAVKFGVNLPGSWDDSGGSPGFVWDVPSDANNIVGGHDVPGLDISASPVGVKTDTWGNEGTITQAALADTAIVEEAYVLLSPDWYSNAGLAPNGINAATLAADLQLVGKGTIPPVGPTPNPPTPPVVPPVVPPVPPLPAILNGTGQTTPMTVTVNVPHLFGTVPVQIPIPALPVSVQVNTTGRRVSAIPWATLGELVLADIAAGKTVPQILADILAFVLQPPVARAGGCGGCGCAPQVSHVCQGGA